MEQANTARLQRKWIQYRRIMDLQEQNPGISKPEIARLAGVSTMTVERARAAHGRGELD